MRKKWLAAVKRATEYSGKGTKRKANENNDDGWNGVSSQSKVRVTVDVDLTDASRTPATKKQKPSTTYSNNRSAQTINHTPSKVTGPVRARSSTTTDDNTRSSSTPARNNHTSYHRGYSPTTTPPPAYDSHNFNSRSSSPPPRHSTARIDGKYTISATTTSHDFPDTTLETHISPSGTFWATMTLRGSMDMQIILSADDRQAEDLQQGRSTTVTWRSEDYETGQRAASDAQMRASCGLMRMEACMGRCGDASMARICDWRGGGIEVSGGRAGGMWKGSGSLLQGGRMVGEGAERRLLPVPGMGRWPVRWCVRTAGRSWDVFICDKVFEDTHSHNIMLLFVSISVPFTPQTRYHPLKEAGHSHAPTISSSFPR